VRYPNLSSLAVCGRASPASRNEELSDARHSNRSGPQAGEISPRTRRRRRLASSARLHRLRLHPRPHRRLGAGAGTAKGRVAPKPGGEFRRCSPRRRRQPRTLTAVSGAVVISKAEEVMRLNELPEADGEAGGVLLGRYRGPHIEIMNCTTPLPEDLRTRFGF